MPQLKPRLTPAQIERLNEARQKLGKGTPILYPEKGMNTGIQFAVLERMKQQKERTLVEKLKHRKINNTKRRIVREMAPAFAKMTPEERAHTRPMIFRTLKTELEKVPFPENAKERQLMERVLKIHRKNGGKGVYSYEKGILKRGSKVQATEITLRLVTRELMEAAGKAGLTRESALTLERVLNNQGHKIKGTKITIYPPREMLFMKMLNEIGEARTLQALEEAGKRAEQIQKEANSIGKTTNYSDAFVNISQKTMAVEMSLQVHLMKKEAFVRQGVKEFRERQAAIEEAKKARAITQEYASRLSKENMALYMEVGKYALQNGLSATVFSR